MFNYSHLDLLNPTLKALHSLGGSATILEIEEEVARIMNLTEEEINSIHKGNMTVLSYRLAWARTNLKNYGLIDNSTRGVWSLTGEGARTTEVDPAEVSRFFRSKIAGRHGAEETAEAETDEPELSKLEWQDELLEILYNISPDQFERLCQRLLRELGFANVEVLGKSGDGGIDGKGVLRLGGVMSFHVVFQSKRYKGSVSSSQLRDFRGGMIGRADKGLFITTGTFTRDARKEAQRDGAPPIDLIDGEMLAEKLKELGLGLNVEMVEKVTVNKEWFGSI